MPSRMLHMWLCLLCCVGASAQYRFHYKNAVYPEVGGNAIYYSLNYERMFTDHLLARAGVGSAQQTFASALLTGGLLGSGSGHVLIMAGLTYVHGRPATNGFGRPVTRNEWRGTAFLGYRYQQRGDRLLFHIGYTPFFGDELIHSAGIACGYRFNWDNVP